MTAHMSCRCLAQIWLQIPRWRTKWRPWNTIIGYNSQTSFFTKLCVQNGGRARVWLYLKHLYFISSGIAYCILPYASFYAGLSCHLYSFTVPYVQFKHKSVNLWMHNLLRKHFWEKLFGNKKQTKLPLSTSSHEYFYPISYMNHQRNHPSFTVDKSVLCDDVSAQ